jgi:hypothetical protein
MGEMDIYLRSTEIIDSDNGRIRETARRLTTGLTEEGPRAQALFYFVRDEIHYNVYMLSTFREDFKASVTLERGKGYCVQKAVLLAALARAAGIPSRLAFARIVNHKMPAELKAQTGIKEFPSHGYTQLFVKGRWMSVTPAFDRALCERIGVSSCDFDGEHDAVLAPWTLPATLTWNTSRSTSLMPTFPLSGFTARSFPSRAGNAPGPKLMPQGATSCHCRDTGSRDGGSHETEERLLHRLHQQARLQVEDTSLHRRNDVPQREFRVGEEVPHRSPQGDLCKDCPFLRSCWTMEEFKRRTA